MRVWMLKQKKKEEKAASQAAMPVVDAQPAIAEAQPASDGADKPVESSEQGVQDEDALVGEASVNTAGDGQPADSEASQPPEVSRNCYFLRPADHSKVPVILRGLKC
jgi:hypothetical protein